ncbi:MAG: hypothetical protein MRY49_01020 [Candidatus Pacebacteria bacterium]|nr:hypothetical protein [Candidatus Paceibacterota bacterium]
MNRKKLVIAIVVIILIILGIFLVTKNTDPLSGQEVSTNNPVDIVLNFYEPWLISAKSTDTDPYKEELFKDPILGKDLRKKIKDSEEQFRTEADPVLCQRTRPDNLSTIISYELPEEVQIVVFSRDEGVDGQSIATLTKHNDGWYISDITCSSGEVGVLKEFSFEKDGYLLRSAELASSGSSDTYLIFAENGVFGSLAPLFFDSESVCTNLDGQKSVCDMSSFGEKTKAIVRGELTEAGVSVKQVEFIKGDLSFE